MNKELIKRSFTKCLNTYNRQAIIQEEMCGRLVERYLGLNARRRPRIFEIGCGTGLLTRKLSMAINWGKLWANDLAPEVEPLLQKSGFLANKQWEFIGGDAESIGFPDRLDLVISGSTFQWMDDLDGLFDKIANALSPSGHLIFNTFGKDNLKEIRSLTRNGLNYYSLKEIEHKLGRCFQVDVAREEIKRLAFPSPKEVIRHLRETGVNGLSPRQWTKRDYTEFKNRYKQDFPMPEGVALSYHPMIFVARKIDEHKSQSASEKEIQLNPVGDQRSVSAQF